jgi:hypothetical protein
MFLGIRLSLLDYESQDLQAELTARSHAEGLALFQAPSQLVYLDRPDHYEWLTVDTAAMIASVAPDGEHLAVVGRVVGGGESLTMLQGLDGTPERVVNREHLGHQLRYDIAPDLSKVALSGPRVKLIELRATSSPDLPVTDRRVPTAAAITWGPDSRHFAFEFKGSIYVHNLETGESRYVVDGFQPAWAPDGRWIAFRTAGGDAMIVPPGGGPSHFLMKGVTVFGGGRWSPDSCYLLYARRYWMHIPYGNVGYLGVYRMRDGARCHIRECGYLGMENPEAYGWVRHYEKVRGRMQPIVGGAYPPR